MLRLTKSTSDENYPISPQTSSVRKLTIKANVGSVADLSNSYLIVKNELSTTINAQGVVRNVGWGQLMSQKNQWQYPATCQLRTASLSIGGQVVEYNEDLHVRKVNMDVYSKSAEKTRKDANTAGMGFQRLEGPKILTDATLANMHSGNYLSPFLNDDLADASTKAQASYKSVSSVIYLSDVFDFCRVAQEVNLAGKEIKIELQFEDRNTLLTEFVNYKTDLTTAPATPRPYPFQTMSVDPTLANVFNVTLGAPFVFANYLLAHEIRVNLTSTYTNVRDIPVYVGQPICLWNTGALPAVPGANFFIVTAVGLLATGIAQITFKAYTLDGATFINTGAATEVTAAQVAACIGTNAVPSVPVCFAMSCVNDPVLRPGGADVTSTFTNLDAGDSTTYSVTGLELVICEMPNTPAKQQTIKYMQYMRDVDVIPVGQLSYQKSFQLEPGCVAIFAMFPCAKDAGGASTNMLSISHRTGVSTGLSYRNMINGESLYSRDIVFSSASDAVEPLYTHRLELAYMPAGLPVENLVQNQCWMSHDGVSTHAMIAEPVPLSEQPQQLVVRLNFDTNTASRTIYVYKACIREVDF